MEQLCGFRGIRAVVSMFLGLLAAAACAGQGAVAPVVTLGITLPVINQPASIQALVTDPALASIPTGTVTVDFGDGSGTATLTLAESRVETTHTYAAPGQFTIRASYGGDTNFSPASKSLVTVSVVGAPVDELRLFGDSLTGGTPTNWPTLLADVLGWTRKSYACGGCKTNDQAPYVYSSMVDSTYASTWLLGQNDSPSNAAMFAQYQGAALAQLAWLAIPEGPEKLRAQSNMVQQTGAWAASDVYATTGLRSTTAGSSLSMTLPGSAIYVGLTSLLTSDYTVDVLIDGVDQGSVSPVEQYTGEYQDSEAYGLRYAIGGNQATQHTVEIVCTDPGTSGCYVDWVGSNGAAARPNLPPYVFAGVTYRTLKSATSPAVTQRADTVRTVESQLASDGLAIRLADIEAVFSGSELPDCSGDGTHPSDCGNQVEETVWLSSMDFLATEAQRIDLGTVPAAVVGTPLTLDEATATSGLPVSYSVVSGPGTLNGDELTATQDGTIVVEADQAGNATVLPAEPVQLTVAAQLATGTTLASSASSAVQDASLTLTATVLADGAPATAGTVTFYEGNTVLGPAAVSAAGTAQMNTTALPVGVDALTADYSGSTDFVASVSGPIDVTITPLPPDFTLSVSPTSLTVMSGQSGTASVLLRPLYGFNEAVSLSCAGLPEHAECIFPAPVAQANGSIVYPLTIRTGSQAAAAIGSNGMMPLFAIFPLALLAPCRRRWRRGVGMSALLLLAGMTMSGCVASLPRATVTVTAQSASGISHSVQLTLIEK